MNHDVQTRTPGFLAQNLASRFDDVLTASDFAALANQLSVDPLLAQKIGFVAARRAEAVGVDSTPSQLPAAAEPNRLSNQGSRGDVGQLTNPHDDVAL
jgi:hypothetical protein